MNNHTTQGSWSLGAIMRDIGRAWQLFRNPNVPSIMKLLLPIAAFIYFILPDLIPGPIDDIAILILALRFFVQLNGHTQGQSGNHQQSAYTNGDQATGATADSATGSATGPTIETSWRVVDE